MDLSILNLILNIMDSMEMHNRHSKFTIHHPHVDSIFYRRRMLCHPFTVTDYGEPFLFFFLLLLNLFVFFGRSVWIRELDFDVDFCIPTKMKRILSHLIMLLNFWWIELDWSNMKSLKANWFGSTVGCTMMQCGKDPNSWSWSKVWWNGKR